MGQIGRQWPGLLAGIAMGLLWTAGRVSIPTLVQRAIDEGMEAGDADVVTRWAIVIAVVAVGTAICTGARRYLAFREARHAEAMLRDRLFGHLVRLSFPYHDQSPTGQLMSRANTDLQQVQNFVVLVPLTIANLVTVIASAVILARIDLSLTVLALGGLPLLVVLTRLPQPPLPHDDGGAGGVGGAGRGRGGDRLRRAGGEGLRGRGGAGRPARGGGRRRLRGIDGRGARAGPLLADPRAAAQPGAGPRPLGGRPPGAGRPAHHR